MKSFVIGIAGGSGSGKSTFAGRLKERFPDEIALVSSDNYYLAHDSLPLSERRKLNYDAPSAFEFDLMVEQIKSLKRGNPVKCPVYDFTVHNRSPQTVLIEPSPVVIIDGILIFSHPELRELLDIRVFVETDADERILRRIRRDVQERGRTIDSVIEQYLSTVKPMHNTYVEPSKQFADIIINGGMNDIAFDIVKTKIEAIIETIKA